MITLQVRCPIQLKINNSYLFADLMFCRNVPCQDLGTATLNNNNINYIPCMYRPVLWLAPAGLFGRTRPASGGGGGGQIMLSPCLVR